jgi:hypothetical protein
VAYFRQREEVTLEKGPLGRERSRLAIAIQMLLLGMGSQSSPRIMVKNVEQNIYMESSSVMELVV